MPKTLQLALYCTLAGLVLAVIGPAEAQAGRLAAARAARTAAIQTAAVKTAAANSAAARTIADPSGCAPAPSCYPTPCITYRHLGPRLCCGCDPAVPTVLNVVDPCTCCPVAISVCLPGCCTGTPTVCSRPGLFAASVVTYDWCCGYSVTIRFKRCGEVVVVTRGV
jgi:hypothetical protein